MKIKIGSANQIKVAALKEILEEYAHLKDAEVSFVGVDSGVSEQPRSLDETVQGAMHRARAAFQDCDYSFGIESGLMTVSKTKSGFMEMTVCAIYDGSQYHLGLSSAWEVPKKLIQHILEDGLDMNQAAFKAGFTDNPEVGSAEGIIGVLTKGRLDRKAYTKEAIRTALIHLEKV